MADQDQVRTLMQAPFLRLLGVEVDSIEPGRVVSRLPVREELNQQNGYVHAGAVGTLADHTAGAACGTGSSGGTVSEGPAAACRCSQ